MEEELPVDPDTTRTVVCVRYGTMLKRLRIGFGIERPEVVERGKLGASTVDDIEDLRIYVSIETGERFAFALGVPSWKVTLLVKAEVAANPTGPGDDTPIGPCEFERRVAALLDAQRPRPRRRR